MFKISNPKNLTKNSISPSNSKVHILEIN